MIRFPGVVYAGSGRSLYRRRRDLSLETIADCEHRAVICWMPGAEIARVWVLANDATAEAIPERVQNQTLEYVWAGVAVLLLARRPEPIQSIRFHLASALAIAALMQRRTVPA